MSLTDTAIKNLKPSDKCKPNRPDKHADANGLWVYVKNTGNKVFLAIYRYQGKQRELTLGKYPAMSLSQARAANLRVREILETGADPKEVIREEKAKQNNQTSFDFFAQKWLAHQQTALSAKAYERESGIYHKHIKPAIGKKDIHEVNFSNALALSEKLANDGFTYTAKRVISTISRIYSFVMLKQLAPNVYNPIPKGAKRTITHKENNYPRIKIHELPKLLQDINSADIEPITKYGFYLLAYTFVRTGELLGMTWGEIDFNARLWRIPAHRMKKGRPHIVPLAPQVIEILENIKALGLPSDFVLYSSRSKTGRYSENVFTMALKRMGYKGKMTGHGFRGLASTSLYEMQYPPKAIELQLAHVSNDKVERAYNEATMLPKRTQMMNEWAKVVEQAQSGDLSAYNARLTASDDNLTAIMQMLDKSTTPATSPNITEITARQ